MRVLLSTTGSRGDVQPLVALGTRLQARGAEVRLCAPPDFSVLVEENGLGFTSLGPSVASFARRAPQTAAARPSPEQMLAIAQATIATQFETLLPASEGCDLLLGAGALQIALRSIAELRGVGYVYASYCPQTLPSARHAPPLWAGDASGASRDNAALWDADATRWNQSWGVALNARRTAAGLPEVANVRDHIFTDRPLLAADPTLAPWPEEAEPGRGPIQTGAWLLNDERPLSIELEGFLDAGEPPVYLGFGSVRAPSDITDAAIAAARRLGRRIVILRGWAGLSASDPDPDVMFVDEVNQQRLFPRVAAAVHHGGAGTTTVALRAGTPQIVAPQLYDQHYFARRVSDLGVGVAIPSAPSAGELASAFETVLDARIRVPAGAIGSSVRADGADIAAGIILGKEAVS